jgi:membrane protein YdbS with pleckstrin-like domain
MDKDENKKVFYLSKGWKIFSIFFIFFCFLFAAMIVYLIILDNSLFIVIFSLILISVCLLCIIYFLLLYKKYSITIADDEIIIQNPFRKKKIDLKYIIMWINNITP